MNEKKQDPLTKMPVFPHFGDLSVPKISIRLLKKKKKKNKHGGASHHSSPHLYGSQALRNQNRGRSWMRLPFTTQKPQGQQNRDFMARTLKDSNLSSCLSSSVSFPVLRSCKSLKAKTNILHRVKTQNKLIVQTNFSKSHVFRGSYMKEMVKYFKSVFSTLLFWGQVNNIQNLV